MISNVDGPAGAPRLPPAAAPGGDPPPLSPPPGDPAPAAALPGPVGLATLPREVVQHIAAPLAPRDLSALSKTGRSLRGDAAPLLERSRIAQRLALTSFAVGSALLQARPGAEILRDMQALPAGMRSDLLQCMVQGNFVGILQTPGLSAQQAFGQALDAINQLHPQHRSAPLTLLICAAATCSPRASMPAALDRALETAARLPDPSRAAMVGLAGDFLVRSAPVETRAAMFDTLDTAIARLPSAMQWDPLLSLAPLIERLEPGSRMSRFNATLDAADRLAPQDRSTPLLQLAAVVHCLPENQRTTAFMRVFDADAASGHHSAGDAIVPSSPLTALAAVVPRLPRHERVAAFETLLDALPLMEPVQRLDVLQPLAAAIKTLPAFNENAQLRAFLGVLREARALEPAQRDPLVNLLRQDALLHAVSWHPEVQAQVLNMTAGHAAS
jgi:hypothetical protein